LRAHPPALSHDAAERQGDIPFQTLTSLDESPLKFGLLYAGTDCGRLHMSPDGGKSWIDRTAGVVPGKWVSRVIASRHAVGTAYCAQNGKHDDDFAAYLFRSRDHGETWEDLGSGLPGGPINVVREDPRHADVLYVGSDLGVYVSVDAGTSWQVVGKGLPICFVHDLLVHPRDHLLVVATHGRGMWTLDVGKVR
jgi:photosystem II stability/assembly factor-like uncharacterized protein